MKTEIHLLVPIAAFLGAFGVAAGAFGTHVLQEMVSGERLATFETGIRYLLLHAVVMLVIGFAESAIPSLKISASGWIFLAGVVLFTGSLTLLVLLDLPFLGAVAPIGGLLLIGAWVHLGVTLIRFRKRN